jgi:uncharacterized membrane protein YqjE
LLDIVQRWKDKINTLVETKVRLVQLEFIERASGVLSFVIFNILFILLGFSVLLFAGFGVAEWLSQLMNSEVSGYFVVAFSFLIIGIVFYLSRKKIRRFLSDKFISVLTEKRDDEDDIDENTQSNSIF